MSTRTLSSLPPLPPLPPNISTHTPSSRPSLPPSLRPSVPRFGFEARERIPFGLDVHSMDYYLQFLKDHQFNALRIPISVDFALDPEGRVEAEVVDAVST